jgi:hypothetical protein
MSLWSCSVYEETATMDRDIQKFGFLVLYKLVRSTSEIKQIHKEIYERLLGTL